MFLVVVGQPILPQDVLCAVLSPGGDNPMKQPDWGCPMMYGSLAEISKILKNFSEKSFSSGGTQ